MIKKLLIVAGIVVLSACTPFVSEVENTDAQELVDSLKVVKSKSGVCYAVGLTSRLDTGGRLSYTNIVTWVPCGDAK